MVSTNLTEILITDFRNFVYPIIYSFYRLYICIFHYFKINMIKILDIKLCFKYLDIKYLENMNRFKYFSHIIILLINCNSIKKKNGK